MANRLGIWLGGLLSPFVVLVERRDEIFLLGLGLTCVVGNRCSIKMSLSTIYIEMAVPSSHFGSSARLLVEMVAAPFLDPVDLLVDDCRASSFSYANESQRQIRRFKSFMPHRWS